MASITNSYNTNFPWSDNEKTALLNALSNAEVEPKQFSGRKWSRVARLVGRKANACQSMYYRLLNGLSMLPSGIRHDRAFGKGHWRYEERAILRKHVKKCEENTWKEAAKEINRFNKKLGYPFIRTADDCSAKWKARGLSIRIRKQDRKGKKLEEKLKCKFDSMPVQRRSISSKQQVRACAKDPIIGVTFSPKWKEHKLMRIPTSPYMEKLAFEDRLDNVSNGGLSSDSLLDLLPKLNPLIDYDADADQIPIPHTGLSMEEKTPNLDCFPDLNKFSDSLTDTEQKSESYFISREFEQQEIPALDSHLSDQSSIIKFDGCLPLSRSSSYQPSIMMADVVSQAYQETSQPLSPLFPTSEEIGLT